MRKKSNRSKRLYIQSGILLFLVITTFLTLGLVFRKQIFHLKATSCGQLTAFVSIDGINPRSSITLPAGVTTKYYVHASSNGMACSTKFDVNVQSCDSGVCGAWNVVSPWGTYKSNDKGIVRLDLDNGWPANRVVNFQIKPAGVNVPWSNKMAITFTANSLQTFSTSTSDINMADYYIFKPGYVWEYTTKNNLTNGTGATRLQIEDETSFCGVRFYPWRFTKSSPDAYWGVGSNRNLRWFVVNPSFTYTPFPSYNNYIWAFGHLGYAINSSDWTNGLRDINYSQIAHLYTYKSMATMTPPIPSYNLSPKSLPANGTYILKRSESMYVPVPPATSCNLKYSGEQPVLPSSWKLRAEKDTLAPWGDVIRLDQYEGQKNLESDMLLRESWYFAKGIGLVKITSKYFNNYAGTGASNCADDSDCWADTMQHPFVEVTLNDYFQNPTLAVAVTGSISTGYDLKITNTPYTGYLEASVNSGAPQKWLWVEKGSVHVPTDKLLAGISTMQFRIWIPNETAEGETRLHSTQLPWSNAVTLTGYVTNCTTSTWYTGYNFVGLNWCQIGSTCNSGWLVNPLIQTSCLNGTRLKNVGTYCTRNDGVRNFTGSTTCSL